MASDADTEPTGAGSPGNPPPEGDGSSADAPPQDATEDLHSQLSRRVKTLRAERGWSLDVLSGACGVSRSMLSQIERDQANPTLAVTLKIAKAFGLSLGELVDTQDREPRIHVIRADDEAFHYRSDGDVKIRTLSPLNLEKDVEFYEVKFQPGGVLESAPHFQGAREFVTVEKGRIDVISSDDHETLRVGDSASYPADVPHTLKNQGRTEAVLFLVVIYR